MTEALFDELMRLNDQALKWEAVYRRALAQAAVAHARRRAIEARILTLMNLSAWVNGQW